jgi:Flp pilus assembly protein TadB
MALRTLLVGLIVAATAAFIVGTTIERNSGDKHSEKSEASKPAAQSVEGSASHEEGGAESPGAHSESAGEAAGRETRQELKPLGIDIEAAPFVALAAVTSLLLALGAWLRSRWLLLLVTIAAAMLVFAALDVREVFHQSDESKAGLAILAGFVGLLHLGAAAVAGLMGREARRSPA